LSALPFHPVTHLQAIGLTRRGPVWPVMGASADHDPDPGPEQGGDPGGTGNQEAKGYPEHTPVAQMSDAQRAAYYKDQNRHTDRLRKDLAKFNGVTPEQVTQMAQELEALRNEKLSADEKALAAATKKALADAQSAADAVWRPKYQMAQLKSVAAQVLTNPGQLTAFLSGTEPGKFAGDDGEIDESKVMDYLTALFGTQQPTPQPAPRWGQHSAGNADPTNRPGDAGKAEALRRFGKKPT
jgi:hypothetical protein